MGFQLGGLAKVEYATDGDTASPTWNTLGTDLQADGLPTEESDQADLADGQSVRSFYRLPFTFSVNDVDNANVGSIDEHIWTWFRFTDLEDNQVEVPATGSGKRGLYPTVEDQLITPAGEISSITISGEATATNKADLYTITRV